MRYALAPNPVFWSIQGEGHLRGFQMVFLRLAGCSIGCNHCDTDYTVDSRATVAEIVAMVKAATPLSCRDSWVWITGGEPLDRDIRPLQQGLSRSGFSVCLATSGKHRAIYPVDWLSVSPHDYRTMQLYGNELKLVDGLHGLDPWEWVKRFPDSDTDFMYRYVQPLWTNGQEDPESLTRCLSFLDDHPNWALSRQDHKHWGQD